MKAKEAKFKCDYLNQQILFEKSTYLNGQIAPPSMLSPGLLMVIC